MKHPKTVTPALGVTLLLALAACGDGKPGVGQLSNGAPKLTLQSVSLGRLVDVYAYQRIDETNPDRRNRFNRRLTLVARDVVVSPGIESQSVYDASGAANPAADYEFRPFDKRVGHEELLILWDNRATSSEAANFERALAAAQGGLIELAASYRGQSTQTRPIPIVPRNAAIRLQFDGKVTLDEAFFQANPSAIQVLEFKGDPSVIEPADAFRELSSRVIPKGDHIVIDTTILGGEAKGGVSTPGLPASSDSVAANIRIAIPSRAGVVSSFFVQADRVEKLNDVDSAGRASVIRDFRSGNLSDGAAGRLREPEEPMIVGALGMGITAVDTGENIVTLNKRLQFVPIRGRYPFVEGPIQLPSPGSDIDKGVPLGPLAVPTTRALPGGDVLTQDIVVEMPDGSFETVTLRAEILQNLEVGTFVGDPLIGRTTLTPPAAPAPQPPSPNQGGWLTTARVRVASVFAGKDSLGREHSFRANTAPTGEDCTVRARYYEDIPFTNSSDKLSDREWRRFFLRVDPTPPSAGGYSDLIVGAQPNASVAIEFTKPMDLDQVDNTSNLLLTNTSVATESFAVQMGSPKSITRRIVPTRLSDLAGDGTVLRLQPPMGLFHLSNQSETYAFHVRLGASGVTDLAGSPLKIFDQPSAPQNSWSLDFTLSPLAAANLIGWHTWVFEGEDEDGTVAGSPDLFGQFRLQNGRLTAAATLRFSRSADNQNLGAISRVTRGECWDSVLDAPVAPDPTVPTLPVVNGQVHPGLLYWQPQMIDSINTPFIPQVFEYWNQNVAQPVGRVAEPHKPQGSRMQMRYLEDDFSLSYRATSDFALDVEQLYWSPFADETVLFDTFDRYTLSLAHSQRRTDIRYQINPADGICWFWPSSLSSSLSSTFSENPLPGTKLTPVLEDEIYRINPNDAFRTAANVKYVPYPRFDRSYTWRDSRLVTVDAGGNVIGLGGALQPGAQAPNDDTTANIDSPWIAGNPDPEFLLAGGTIWVEDTGDFKGDQQRDHDPIALPLLVDFKVYTDSAANGLSLGTNGFQVALLGAPSNFANPAGPIPGGYYDTQPTGLPGSGGRPNWPRVRVHTSGGESITNPELDVTVDVANVLTAVGGPTKDAGLGNPARAIFIAPPGDGMLHWARADFVRKTSTMTFGFFDTLRPQWAAADAAPTFGFPTFTAAPAADSELRIRDLVVQLDPPQARQPAGTTVVLEMRGADGFAKDDVLYDPATSDEPNDDAGAVPPIVGRGNVLNPNFACEAYRYSTTNLGSGLARVPADGLTRYVTEDQLNLIRNPATGLLPRFLNMRLVMTNNVDVTPALSPSLRSMNIVYRLEQAP